MKANIETLHSILLRLHIYKKLYTQLLISAAEGHVISFPKSGRTWIRFFLAKYFSECFNTPLTLEFATLRKVHNNVPRIGFSHRGSQAGNKAAMEKEILDLVQKIKRFILLVRDPRDVVVSYYYQITKRTRRVKTEMTISEFIRDEVYGIERIINFMNFWLECMKKHEKSILIKYEDCKKDTENEFIKILEFLGFNTINTLAFRTALDYSSFDNMKKIETQNEFDTHLIKPSDPNDPNSYKVRKGEIGGYKDSLGNEDIEYVEKAIKNLADSFNYFPNL